MRKPRAPPAQPVRESLCAASAPPPRTDVLDASLSKSTDDVGRLASQPRRRRDTRPGNSGIECKFLGERGRDTRPFRREREKGADPVLSELATCHNHSRRLTTSFSGNDEPLLQKRVADPGPDSPSRRRSRGANGRFGPLVDRSCPLQRGYFWTSRYKQKCNQASGGSVPTSS